TTSAGNGIGYHPLMDKLLQAGLSGRQADTYIDTLLRHQVLLTDLELPVSGAGNGWGNGAVRAHPALNPIKAAASNQQPGNALTAHERAAAELDRGDEPIFQCDMRTGTAANRLNTKVTDTVVSEIRDLMPLNRQLHTTEMKRFTQGFTARYGD